MRMINIINIKICIISEECKEMPLDIKIDKLTTLMRNVITPDSIVTLDEVTGREKRVTGR